VRAHECVCVCNCMSVFVRVCLQLCECICERVCVRERARVYVCECVILYVHSRARLFPYLVLRFNRSVSKKQFKFTLRKAAGLSRL
jgi:hypothetical protein